MLVGIKIYLIFNLGIKPHFMNDKNKVADLNKKKIEL